MKKSNKNSWIVAILLIGVGLTVVLAAMTTIKFDLRKLNRLTFGIETYVADENFTNLSIRTAEFDVRFYLWDEKSAKIVCHESKDISHSVSIENGTLTLNRIDKRNWFDRIGFNIFEDGLKLDVYLPEKSFTALEIKNVSGNIDIPSDFSFENAALESVSGEIDFASAVGESLSLKSVSGDLKIETTNPKELTAQTTSGDIELSEIRVSGLSAHAIDGMIRLADVVASGKLQLETVSGSIRLEDCDADSLRLKSVSGDMIGSLLSEKIFFAETTSGRVDVPPSVSGGDCEIKTVSGDIEFSFVE